MMTSHLNSVKIPSEGNVIKTWPAILNDETDVRMGFHMIKEATAGSEPIQIISDKTGIPLISVEHFLHLRSSGLP